jgi:prophage antirepressor-like protein
MGILLNHFILGDVNRMDSLTFEFNGEKFRTITDRKNTEWFHASDVCNVLKFANTPRTLSDYIKPEWKREYSDGIRGGKAAWYISEPALYKLIFKSKSETAEQFQDWVFSDVLPRLRQTGVYIDESRFDAEEVERLRTIVKQRDNRIAKLTNCTEVLIDDIERVFHDHAEFLILGHINRMDGLRPTKTFSQVRKDLVNMGFEQYTTERFRLAIDIFLSRPGHIYPKTINMNDKTHSISQQVDKFMEALYQSMRYDGDVSDPDTSMNMYRFQKLFGVKYGEHRKQDRDNNAIEHIADIKEELIG